MDILAMKGEMKMKKLLSLLVILVMIAGSASASIMEPKGIDLSFKLFSGIEAKRAVVLCRSLSAHTDSNASSRKATTLSVGNTFLTWESQGEWINCYYSDGRDAAWVRNYYVIEDPAYYVTDGQTAVYAYADTTAPRVALLGRNEELPIIMETDQWCVVSLRGASGWIRKTSKDMVRRSWFKPESLQNITAAELTWQSGHTQLKDPTLLAQLSALLSDTYEMGRAVAGCPFGTYLTLTLEDDEKVVVELASDSCGIYRIYGRDYRYGSSTHAGSRQLLSLFPGYQP